MSSFSVQFMRLDMGSMSDANKDVTHSDLSSAPSPREILLRGQSQGLYIVLASVECK